MCPWYLGFKGSIVPSAEKDGFEMVGVVDKRGPTTIEIVELQPRKWTQDFKEMLQSMLPTGEGAGQIEDFKEYHTEVSVHFVVTVTEEQMSSIEATGPEKFFKLRSGLPTSNMFLFDRDGKIRKFESEREILEDFAELRLSYYHKRRDFMLRALRQQAEVLREKVRFIRAVVSEDIKIKNRKREQLIEDLRKRRFRTLNEIAEGDLDMVEGAVGAQTEDAAEKKEKSGGWEYLAGMPIWSLTMERVASLEAQLEIKAAEVRKLEETAPEELWEADLDAILAEFTEIESARKLAASREGRMRAGAQKRAGRGLVLSSAKRFRSGEPIASSAPPLPSSANQAPCSCSGEFGTLDPITFSGAPSQPSGTHFASPKLPAFTPPGPPSEQAMPRL